MKNKIILLIVFLFVPFYSFAEVTLELPYTGKNFFVGEKIKQKILLRSQAKKEINGFLRWSTTIKQAVIQRGESKIKLVPNEPLEMYIDLISPVAKRKVSLVLKIEFFSGDNKQVEKKVLFSLFPLVDFDFIKRLAGEEKIGIFNKQGNSKEFFKELVLEELPNDHSLAFFRGKIVLAYFPNTEEIFRDLHLLEQKASEGTIVIISLKGNRKIGTPQVLDEKHRILYGLTQDDFDGWDGKVAAFLPVFQRDSTVVLAYEGKPLCAEWFTGKGKIILCFFDLSENDPVTAILFYNVLTYAYSSF